MAAGFGIIGGMKSKILAIAACTAMFCCAETVDELSKTTRPPQPVRLDLGQLEWKVPKRGGSRVGDVITLENTSETPDSTVFASAVVDPEKLKGHYLRLNVKVKGTGVAANKKSDYGAKVMLRWVSESGNKNWPQSPTKSGDWDEVMSFDCDLTDAKIKEAVINIGLQRVTGRVEFDVSTIEAWDLGDVFPLVNQDFKVSYPKSVKKGCNYRGVMLPTNLDGIKEDDFATLGKWGANIVRYQIAKDWKKVNGWESNDDYDAYVDHALDILAEKVLPWAEKYGQKVVIDLHATPGARNEKEENRMFFEKRYAKHFVLTWKKIATRFKGDKRIYGYDLVNEPHQTGPAPYSYLHVQWLAARMIRTVDPDVTIIVAAKGYGHPAGFKKLSPLRMDNIIYQSHCYAPMGFTHQHLRDGERVKVDPYPNPEKGWDKECIKKALGPVLEFQKKHNAKIYIGEFSAIAWAPGADQYIRDCIEIFDEYGWDWCYHAFREYKGWSVEHEFKGRVNNRDKLEESEDNPRKRALLDGFKRNKGTP